MLEVFASPWFSPVLIYHCRLYSYLTFWHAWGSDSQQDYPTLDAACLERPPLQLYGELGW
jgi:hypothetical protein